MDIVIIGSGNVATVMGRKIKAAGHRIVQVAGRSLAGTRKLASMLETSCTTDMSRLNKDAGMYFIAITDDALMSVGEWLYTGDSLTVHTAGSVRMDVLKKTSSRYGVVYPLQSLRTERLAISGIPLLADGNTPEALDRIMDFARTVSSTVVRADDEYRKKIHLAAVISGNFSNHLFTLAHDYCRQESLDFSLLLPLLKETVARLEHDTPENMQTGPAKRNDTSTIRQHIQMLEAYPELKNIYTLLSDSIRNQNK